MSEKTAQNSMDYNLKNIETRDYLKGIAVFDTGLSLIWCSDSIKSLFSDSQNDLERICRECIGDKRESLQENCSPGVIYEGDVRTGEHILKAAFYITPCGPGNPLTITASFINIAESENLLSKYEKVIPNYILSLENAKIVPWEYDIRKQVIKNIFGINFVLEGNILQLTLEEWKSMIHPDDVDTVVHCIEDSVSGKSEEFYAEYRIVTGQDNIMWLKTVGRVSDRDEKGRPSIVSGINQDITEMKLLELKSITREEKLRNSENRLKHAMRLGKISPWEYDFSKDTFITDRQMSEIWGYSDYYDRGERINSETLAQRLYPDDRDIVISRFMDAIENRTGFDISFRIVVEGEIKYIHFESEVVSDQDGNPEKFVGVAQDVTGIKRLEDKLARQFERLRFIAEKIGLGIWEMKTASGIISLMNFINYSSMSGDTDDLTLEHLLSIIHPDDIDLFKTKMARHFAGEDSVVEVEVRIKRSDGNNQYSWYYIASVIGKSDSDGKAVEIGGFFQNTTDRKEMESKLYQSQKMEAIGRLAGGIAHDFNNILQIILGYGSLALMETDSDSELFETVSHIIDSGEKARALVRQLLLFARQDKFNPSRISIALLIKGLLSMLKRLIGENITLAFNSEEGLYNIHGDPGQIEQVFLNLCINSRDAISGSGSIIINAKNVTIDDYWPSYDTPVPPGNYVMISVSDTGCGIEDEYLDSIFEPFFTTKEKNSGTGLGLATVYSIVKNHNGYIELYTMPDKGTTFIIYLPEEVPEYLVDGDEGENKQADDIDAPSLKFMGGETIILAEDDELVRKYTARILTESGYRVIIAVDGAAAVELFNLHRDEVDLLILDVVMPKINGWDVYNKIGGPESGIPVIFFSGYDRHFLPPDIASMPNMRYVQKPFKYYAIIKAVHELLDWRS